MALCPPDVTPAVATVIWPGLAFIASSRSFIDLYGVFGLTPTSGTLATLRNRCQSVRLVSSMPSARYTPRSCAAPAVHVCPSLGASSALLVPIEPEAPGWLTITTFWPRCFSSSAAVMRVTWSVEPPAAQGTMIVTGFDGFQFWEYAGSAASTPSNNRNFFMSPPQCVENHVRDMPRTPGKGARRHQVALEDARKRIAVAQVEVPLAGNRDVELHRVDPAAEQPLRLAPAQHVAQQRHQVRMHLRHAARAAHVPALVQVLAVQQGHEFRMLEEVVPGEGHQAAHRLARIEVLEPERALGVADMRVAPFQRGEEQAFLVAEVVVEHALVRPRARRDAVDARPAEPVARELRGRRFENLLLGMIHSMPSRR